jgi:uncharacterized protein (TIGR03118 family)
MRRSTGRTAAIAALLGGLTAGIPLSCTRAASAMDMNGPGYLQHNLLSDDTSKIPADHEDPTLLNSWGVAFPPGGPFWINDNNSGIVALYLGDGTGVGGKDPAPAVTIPTPVGGTPPSAPTGIVWNGSSNFNVKSNSSPALFIFDTEDGTISAWNGGLGIPGTAELEVDNSAETCTNGATGAVYKALALGTNTSGVFLFATNFRCATVDVFDGNFKPATLSGSFQDPEIPEGFAPFGMVNVLGNLVVTYAKQNAQKHDDVAGAGNGFVDIFDTNGNLIQRLVRRGHLNSPWGVALAPFSFGELRNQLLIGNFGDGTINAYDPTTGRFRDQVEDTTGQPITIDGLWSLVFGGGENSDPTSLYFTAGPNNESDGLFGVITPQ